MTHRSFTGTLDQILELIKQALTAIEQGGGQPELQSLQKLLGELLINCMRLLERNPGIEAAVADLYAAASALIRDSSEGGRPSARTRRLFGEARTRFQERVSTANPSEHGTRIVWRHHELLQAA